jgi:hypothetical protein
LLHDAEGRFIAVWYSLLHYLATLHLHNALQDTYKITTTSAYDTLKSNHDSATSTCNQLTHQINKQQGDHAAELAALQEAHAASLKQQQLEAEGLRQQLQAEQARAAAAEQQLAAAKAAAEQDAATFTKHQAEIAGVFAQLSLSGAYMNEVKMGLQLVCTTVQKNCICSASLASGSVVCVHFVAINMPLTPPACAAYCPLRHFKPPPPPAASPELSATHEDAKAKLSETSTQLQEAHEQVRAASLDSWMLPTKNNVSCKHACT